MDDNKRLGKGLTAIFGEGIEDVLEDIQKGAVDNPSQQIAIPINKIRTNPYQPRKDFDETKISELAQSIKEHGVFTPILVREALQGYELVAGERRLRASKSLDLETIPAIIVDIEDEAMMEIGLLENIQREDLNVIEEANAYQQLIDKLGYTQEQLATRIGKSRTHVTNLLRLRRLPDYIQELVVAGKLSMGHVRPLIPLEDPEVAIYYANRIVEEDLPVRAVERLIKEGEATPRRKEEPVVDRDLDNVRKTIERRLQTKVKINNHQIIINYQDVSDLNRILEILDLLDEEM